MAKTAPTDFPYIPTGKILPKEPVVEGGGTFPDRGLQDFIQGLNHVARFLTPTVIMQWMQFWQFGIGGTRYLSTADQTTDTNMTRRLMYRIPTVNGIGSAGGAAVDRLQVRAWCEADSTNGTLRITSGDAGSPFDTTISNNGDWTEYSINVPYDSTGTYEDIEVWTQAGAAGDDIHMKSLTAWIEAGANPCADGYDVEPWVDDEPLATYMHRIAAAKLEALARERVGVIVNCSDDYENLGRGDGSVTSDTVRFMDRLQAKLGPYTRQLRVYVNGYYNGASAGSVVITTKNNTALGNSGISLTLDSLATFTADPTATWKTNTITVANADPLQPLSDLVNVDIVAPSGVTTTISSIAIWEEPS